MEKCREQHRDLYIAFVDLSEAFDSVDCSGLFFKGAAGEGTA